MLWLDADDVLPPATAEAILHSVINAPPNQLGFIVPVQFVDGGPAGGTRVDHVKLFPNLNALPGRPEQPGLGFQFHIHEQILPSLRAVRAMHGRTHLGRIDAPVLHKNYDNSIAGQKRKRERDWPLLLKDLAEYPDHPFVQFNCGMTAFYEGEPEKAMPYLERCIELSTNGESHLRKAYVLLGQSLRALKKDQEALDTFLVGLQAVGEEPELRFQAAISYDHLGMLAEAREFYLAVAPDTSGAFSSMDVGITGFKRSFNLGSVASRMGRYDESKDWLRKASDENPFSVDAPAFLFEVAMQFGDVTEALGCTERVRQIAGPGELWAALRVRVSAACGEPAESVLNRLCSEYPGAPGPLLLLSRELLARGDERRAEPILNSLAGRGNPEACFHLGVMALRRGQYDAARRYTAHAVQLDPGSEAARRQLASLDEMLQGVPHAKPRRTRTRPHPRPARPSSSPAAKRFAG